MSYQLTDDEILAIEAECIKENGNYLDTIKFAKKIIAESKDALASKLIDVWCFNHNSQISWQKAVQIIAIVTKMSDEERDKLLNMD